jgi:hypothetical protein
MVAYDLEAAKDATPQFANARKDRRQQVFQLQLGEKCVRAQSVKKKKPMTNKA